MVKISGTLSSNVTLSGRMLGGQSGDVQAQVKPVEKALKPVALKDHQPDMRFSGIGRTIDIRV
ncbi:hypothetical protein A9Q83_13175 [Alphaproteobacteria bacterium 46_93_T64]|nr:hypothetical protein A9Q83_13175 [Alphaproteobacteria bacterium 46_93_T64]